LATRQPRIYQQRFKPKMIGPDLHRGLLTVRETNAETSARLHEDALPGRCLVLDFFSALSGFPGGLVSSFLRATLNGMTGLLGS